MASARAPPRPSPCRKSTITTCVTACSGALSSALSVSSRRRRSISAIRDASTAAPSPLAAKSPSTSISRPSISPSFSTGQLSNVKPHVAGELSSVRGYTDPARGGSHSTKARCSSATEVSVRYVSSASSADRVYTSETGTVCHSTRTRPAASSSEGNSTDLRTVSDSTRCGPLLRRAKGWENAAFVARKQNEQRKWLLARCAQTPGRV